MDPLDIMMNKDRVVPYFLPIISADTQKVIGYEVEAYWIENNKPMNVTWFFDDHDIPREYRIEMEDHLQARAFETFETQFNTEQPVTLFFHYNSKLLEVDNGETLLGRLTKMKDNGMPFQQIVVIIGFDRSLEELFDVKHTIMYIQSLGIQIALDAEDTTTSQLEFISQIRPNVIRVSCGFLQENALPSMYSDIHHSLSSLARKIGSTLLFNGITSFAQLNYAWRNGGRYYQGSYLQKAVPTNPNEPIEQVQLMKDMNHFIAFERKKVEAQLTLSNELTLSLKQVLKGIPQNESLDSMVLTIAKALTNYTFRVYICNENGYQESSNGEKDECGNWYLRMESKAKNWSWRPYFLENIVRMNVEKKGILSDLYTDIDKDEQIRTYSYPLSDALYIFIDIPYRYLFDQNDLL
ncbi:EAL domain-containing protein [Bacillus sp. C1-1]|nr:EAL domain-containing protein [Bacillus sp. C1-1]